jgi:hypothetical protein
MKQSHQLLLLLLSLLSTLSVTFTIPCILFNRTTCRLFTEALVGHCICYESAQNPQKRGMTITCCDQQSAPELHYPGPAKECFSWDFDIDSQQFDQCCQGLGDAVGAFCW